VNQSQISGNVPLQKGWNMDKNIRHRFDVDPILEKISPHIPDEEINYLLPFRRCHVQGRIREFQSRSYFYLQAWRLIQNPKLKT